MQQVRIKGVGSTGEAVVEGALEGWYILAGGTRAYEFPLPADRCADVQVLSVHVQTAESMFSERLDVSPGGCEQ